MCYSEFTDIIPAIDNLDADVISFEASRSNLEILDELKAKNFKQKWDLGFTISTHLKANEGEIDQHNRSYPSKKFQEESLDQP